MAHHRGWSAPALALTLTLALDTGCSGPPPTCSAPVVLDTTFSIDPDGPLTQIHANAAFDGSTLWVAYNLPDGEGSGGFDVVAKRLHCDGTAASQRIQVTTTAGGNDVDPSIALGAGTVGIAWTSDNSTGANNLDILYRLFDDEGAPVMESDAVLETTYQGDPVDGNALAPAMVARGDGYAIVGARALESAGTFQTFVQHLAADGSLVGEAVDPKVEPGVSHSTPSAALAGDTLHLAWVRSPSVDQDVVVHTAHVEGAAVTEPAEPPEVVAGQQGSAPNVAVDDGGRVLLAFNTTGTDPDIVLAAGDRFGETPPMAMLGAAGSLDHSPVVAPGPGGGLVAWYRNISGFRNEIVIQHFNFDGTDFSLDEEQVLDTEPAAPYPLAVTYVQDGAYFIAWSEGTSPDFVLKGRFVAP